MLQSSRKIVAQPHALVLKSSRSTKLVDTSAASTAAPTVSTDGADCSQFTELTVICKKLTALYKIRLWWYYANSDQWVPESAASHDVNANEAAAFVVNTGAASGVYVQVVDNAAPVAIVVWAEADK